MERIFALFFVVLWLFIAQFDKDCYNDSMENTEVKNEDDALEVSSESSANEDNLKIKNKREKIDKLFAKKDIKYRGPLTYRSIRVLGFILMIFAQIYLAYTLVNKFVDVPQGVLDTVDVLNFLSAFALPMFLAANFCVIMSSRNKIKKYLLSYSIIAIAIYLGVVLVYYRYLYGAMFAIVKDKDLAILMADSISNKLFGGMVNYNVFIDLALFSMFFFFLFYTPKKPLTRKMYLAFRWCSIIPVLLATTSFVLYGLNYMGKIELSMAVLALLPNRSLTIYIIMFALSIVMKLRKKIFIKWGGNSEEYEQYLHTNRNSLEVAIINSIVVLVICLIDFAIMYIDISLVLFGLGTSWYVVAIIPFIFLLSYSRKPKIALLDYVLPALFVVACVIVYLEAFLYGVKHLFN